MRRKPTPVRFSLDLKPTTARRLRRLAAREGMSMCQFVEHVIRKHRGPRKGKEQEEPTVTIPANTLEPGRAIRIHATGSIVLGDEPEARSVAGHAGPEQTSDAKDSGANRPTGTPPVHEAGPVEADVAAGSTPATPLSPLPPTPAPDPPPPTIVRDFAAPDAPAWIAQIVEYASDGIDPPESVMAQFRAWQRGEDVNPEGRLLIPEEEETQP